MKLCSQIKLVVDDAATEPEAWPLVSIDAGIALNLVQVAPPSVVMPEEAEAVCPIKVVGVPATQSTPIASLIA